MADDFDYTKAKREQIEDWLILYVPESHFAEFLVVKVIGNDADTGNVQYEYWPENEATENVEEAGVFLRGSIKWDGSSSWLFNQGDGGQYMLHFCGARQATSIGRLMQRMYEIALVVVDEFYCGLAEMEERDG